MVERKEMKRFIKACLDFVNFNNDKVIPAFRKYISAEGEQAEFFRNELVKVKKELEEDIEFFMESDPAVDFKEEIVIAYPGYLAISYYRIAHVLREMGFLLISRVITEIAHSQAGIDIHPGATIASPFFIDHGTGIVIGETAVIGKRVKIYQGVTLGALSLSKGQQLKGIKRHPTIGDNVTIYSGASILGDVKIGNDVTIGSNVFLTENVPDNTRVSISKPVLVVNKKS